MAKVIFDSEKELEDLIVSKLESENVSPFDGVPVDSFYQQFPIGAYGVADILTVSFEPDPDGPPTVHYTIIEVKKEVIKSDSVSQLSRYIKGLSHLLSEAEINHEWYVDGVLVAPGIDLNGDTCFLCDMVELITFYKAFCDLDSGLQFKESSGWLRSDVMANEDTISFIKALNDQVQKMQAVMSEQMEKLR